MEEQINSAQHSHSTPHKTAPALGSKLSSSVKMIITSAVVIAAAALGFFGGMQYQKGKTPSTAMAMTGQSENSSMNGGGRNGRMGEFGTVTAVSSGSISVKSERTNSTATYAINSSTTITNNGSTASYSDIAVGNTVIVETSSSDSATAARIVINPSMNGGPQMNSSSGATSQTN